MTIEAENEDKIMTNYIVFDNEGRTSDRYTIVVRESGNVFAACEPTGESAITVRYCGNCADHRIVLYGTGWRQMPLSRKIIIAESDNYIRNAQLNPAWLGNELSRQDWPASLQDCVDQMNKSHAVGVHPIPGMPYIGPQNDGNSPKTAMAS
jgi:hypothetical protein